ncbi:YbjO family protein [Pantoea dispersa]|uniref:YbjO family protein n=1 Tax=Pantoea dispersa TaxID=59814 RepID=UPI000736A34B|nr:YbjO family protein [Pantoea dispersa]KTS00053.1 membrane protein [Pantoea dispersa]KTS32902.1 membrane protein [Pantoea dispersa]KTS59349.1 membrane protein [Pantoea dispersa]MCW0320750.1 Inner membrane protein YbjO [Pantoea dispersa]MCW0325486.1 Inner membrane protein YbjO [Pantoea dispersa]
MSETLKNLVLTSTPVPVTIAGSAIIATRCISVLMLANELGYDEIANFVHRSAQAWDSTLIFIASQLIFLFELRCAFTLMRGSNAGRWGYVATQIVVLLYMLMASVGWIYPEIFSIPGENNAQIIHHTLLQKLPDVLVLLLLFVPASSRAFFRGR